MAQKYGMDCLLHEKPFAGINGSGKHLNWSLGNGTQGNLLEPGDTPHENMQFLVFCAAVIRAVHKYSGLLRAVVATADNDHRLGANEAPPAIISIFLGDQLTDVFEQIKGGGAKTSKAKGTLTVGVDTLPSLPKDAGDRNRTSPFAFTGNKFEFRAVGCSQSHRRAAGGAEHDRGRVARLHRHRAGKGHRRRPGKLNAAVQKLLQDIIAKHGAIIFNGDNYTEDWHEEAEKRGLPNLKTCVDALPVLGSPEVVAAVRQVRRALAPRDCRAATTSTSSSTQDGQHRGQADGRDRQDDDLPRGRPLSERAGHDLHQPQAARLHVRHRHARRDHAGW